MSVVPWLKESLKSSDLNYEERHHAEVFTAYQVAEKEGASPAEVAKVVVVFANERPLGLVLPANRKVDPHAVARIVGASRVRLATEAEMQRLFPDCDVGAIPPLNHWKGIDFWVDSSMETPMGEIVIQAGTHQDAVRLRYVDWLSLVKPRVERFSLRCIPSGPLSDKDSDRAKGEQWDCVP